MDAVPPPDRAAEPDGFVVVVEPGDRIHFLDWGGRGRGGAAPGVLLIHGLSNTAWSWAPVARRLRGRPARRRDGPARPRPVRRADRGLRPGDLRPSDVVAVAEGSGLLASRRRPGRPRRSRVRGDRRRLGRGGAGRPLRRARPRRRRLGVARGRHRHGRRRVPARPRRAARGHALDDGVPRRPRGVRPGDLGRRPGAGGPGDGRRDARRQGRAVDAAARARGQRPGDVRATTRCATLAAVDGAGRRRWSPPTTRPGRGRRRSPRPRRRARRPGRTPIQARVVRPRRAQPDALPSGGGQRGDPVGRRRDRPASEARIAMQVVYSPAHLGHDITIETYMGVAVPANEVAERAERIRVGARGRRRLRARRRRPSTARPRSPRSTTRASSGSSRSPGPSSAAQGIDRPFLSADTYPNRVDVRGHVAPRPSPRSSASRSTPADGPGSGASTRRRRSSPARTSPRGPPSTSR